jgi:hypothetical protein
VTGWEPAAIAAVTAILTLVAGKLFDRWMSRDTQNLALTGQQIVDGATIRSELWKRVETLEAREVEYLKARNQQDIEISRLRESESDCQRRLREFGREMAEWRERMEKESISHGNRRHGAEGAAEGRPRTGRDPGRHAEDEPGDAQRL